MGTMGVCCCGEEGPGSSGRCRECFIAGATGPPSTTFCCIPDPFNLEATHTAGSILGFGNLAGSFVMTSTDYNGSLFFLADRCVTITSGGTIYARWAYNCAAGSITWLGWNSSADCMAASTVAPSTCALCGIGDVSAVCRPFYHVQTINMGPTFTCTMTE